MSRVDRRSLLPVILILAVAGAGVYLTGVVAPLLLRIPGVRFVDFYVGIAVVQVTLTVVFPFAFARIILKIRPTELGLNTRQLGRNFLLACGLYSVVLLSVLFTCSEDPRLSQHVTRSFQGGKLVLVTASMCLIAAGTDLATRGYLLLGLVRYTPSWFAVIMQNVLWVWGHRTEIDQFSGSECLGRPMATALVVMTGVVGDVIALRTGSVIGLSMAHALVNMALVVHVRGL